MAGPATNNIPGLPLATDVDATDQVWIVQNSVDKRAPVSLIAALAQVSANVALTFQAPLQKSGNTVSLGGFVGTTDNGVMYRASSAAVGVTAAGTIGQLLMAQGAALPPTWAPAGSTGQILLGRTTAAVAWLSAASTGQLLVATTGNDPFWIPAGVSGQVLVGATGANPFWTATIPGSAGVTSFSAGTTGLTPSSATVGAVLLGGVTTIRTPTPTPCRLRP